LASWDLGGPELALVLKQTRRHWESLSPSLSLSLSLYTYIYIYYIYIHIYIYGGVSFVAWHAGVPRPGDFLDKIPGRAEQVRPPSGAIG